MKRYPRELLLKSRKQSLFRPLISLSLSFSLLLSPLDFYFAFPFRCFSLSRSLRFVQRPLSVAKSSFSPSAFHQSNLIKVYPPSCFVRLLSVSPAACGFSFICTRACGETPRPLRASYSSGQTEIWIILPVNLVKCPPNEIWCWSRPPRAQSAAAVGHAITWLQLSGLFNYIGNCTSSKEKLASESNRSKSPRERQDSARFDSSGNGGFKVQSGSRC